jgi:hypothetical protein
MDCSRRVAILYTMQAHRCSFPLLLIDEVSVASLSLNLVHPLNHVLMLLLR